MILDQEELARIIGQAVGSGSVCWANVAGAGEFNSTEAAAVVDRVVAEVNRLAGYGRLPCGAVRLTEADPGRYFVSTWAGLDDGGPGKLVGPFMRPIADPFVSHRVHTRFSWRDRLRILFGRGYMVRMSITADPPVVSAVMRLAVVDEMICLPDPVATTLERATEAGGEALSAVGS